MARPLSLLLTLVCLGTPIAACGGGEDPPESTPEFDAAYAPINEEILEIAGASVEAIGEPGGPAKSLEAGKISELAQQSADLSRQVAALEPPEDLVDGTTTLETTLADTADGFETLAAAAEKGEQEAATAAIQALAPVGQELNGAQDFLAEATGTPTGEQG